MQALGAGVQDARRDQMKDKLLAVHHQGVAGVVAALIPHHHLRLPGQEVDDLPLAFVTPLGAHHHYVRQCFVLLFTNPVY